MRRAVIFDFGGVLMKTVDYGPRHRWDERLNLTPGSVERIVHGSPSWIQAQSGLLSPALYWADVARQLGLATAEVKQLAEDFYGGDRLDQMLTQYVRDLRDRGHPVALLSNDTPELREKLRDLNILDLFDAVVISGEVGVMKPARSAYQIVLDRLERRAEDAVFIDDRLDNVMGAKNIGMLGIHYTPGIDLPAALAPLLIR